MTGDPKNSEVGNKTVNYNDWITYLYPHRSGLFVYIRMSSFNSTWRTVSAFSMGFVKGSGWIVNLPKTWNSIFRSLNSQRISVNLRSFGAGDFMLDSCFGSMNRSIRHVFFPETICHCFCGT